MENVVLNESKMMQLLDWSYEKAIKGLPGLETVEELSKKYIKESNSIDEAIDKLIIWQKLKCGTSGFLTGVGGMITLPVSIPANISSVVYTQIRMIAAIAHMKGYDLKDDQVRTFVYLVLTGKAGTEILKKSGVDIGTKISISLIKKMPTEVIKQINKQVGFRLVTKFGEKGIINLGKCIPIVGGAIGASVDILGTDLIGKTAKKIFH